jgi:uncharacterized protein
MIGVAFDTNIVVSAFLNEHGLEPTAVDLALAGVLQMFVSEAILAEYEETLFRPKFKMSPKEVKGLMAALRQVTTIIEPTETLTASPHEADNRFLECVESAHADFLITGNKRHFPAEWKGTRIVNAREFFNIIDLEAGDPPEST